MKAFIGPFSCYSPIYGRDILPHGRSNGEPDDLDLRIYAMFLYLLHLGIELEFGVFSIGEYETGL